MAVKYKKNGTWYDISSSSNNAVDAVENGNLNSVRIYMRIAGTASRCGDYMRGRSGER